MNLNVTNINVNANFLGYEKRVQCTSWVCGGKINDNINSILDYDAILVYTVRTIIGYHTCNRIIRVELYQ